MKEVQNAKTHIDRNKRVLMLGPAGVGKTTQFLTLPGRKFMYVFDPNCRESLEGFDVDLVEFVPDVTDMDLSVKTLKKDAGDPAQLKRVPKTYIEWEEDFNKREAEGFFAEYDWLGFDSMTTLSEIIMDRVQYLNKRLGKHPEQADYTAEMNAFKNIFRVATGGLGINVFATAHTEMQRDETTMKTYAQLLITGRNRTRIPMRFSQIYGLEVEVKKDKPTYSAHTVQSRMFPSCRTNIRSLETIEDVTIDFNKDPIGQGIGRFVMGGTTKPAQPAHKERA